MIFRRYSHGHSIAVGVLIGILLGRHLWLVLLGGVGIGYGLARARASYVWLSGVIREHSHKRAAKGVTTEPQPVYSTRRRPADTYGEIPYG